MPTYREDLHLGHEVPTVETDDIVDKSITGNKLADRIIDWFHIIAKAIRNEHIDDGAVDTRTLADESVTTPKIADKAVTPEKLSDRIVPEVIDPLLKPLKDKDADLQNQIDSLQIHGMAVSNQFGDDTHIGISQNTITLALNKIWGKLEDITGEVLQGFSMQVTPEYYIGETGADVHITANTVETNGIFEHIAFYGNGVLIAEADNEDFFEHVFHIDETTVVQCVAKIMGVEYERQGIITHYSSFLLGSGDTYADLMDANGRFPPQYVIPKEYQQPLTSGMRGAYDVSVAEGKRIIIVVGDSLSEGFIRADLNGVEIQFTESTCTDADGKTYKVFTSEPWSAGDYNIDING